MLDTCPIIGDPVEHLLRCTAGSARILGVIDGTAAERGSTGASHPGLPLLSISRPHQLPPEERARVSSGGGQGSSGAG